MPLNIIVYIVLIILSSTEAYLLNSRLGYTPLLFLIMLGIIDALLAFVQHFAVKFEIESRKISITRGNVSSVSFNIKNSFPFYIANARAVMQLCGDNIEKPVKYVCRFSVGCKELNPVDFKVSPPHIGIFTAKVKSVRVYSPLGLFAISPKKPQPLTVYVLPRFDETAVNEKGILISASGAEENGSSVNLQGNEFYSGIREYEPGDSMQRIHWKLSAHVLKYMTRLFEGETESSLTVVVDLPYAGTNRFERLTLRDKIAETSLSMVSAILNEGKRADLIYADGKKKVDLSLNDKNEISAAAFEIAAAKPPLFKIIKNAEKIQGALLFITCDHDKTITQSLIEQKAGGAAPMLIFVKDKKSAADNDFFDSLQKNEIEYETVETE